MIYRLTGTIVSRGENFAVLDIGGIGLQVFMSAETLKKLPGLDETITVYTFLYNREDGFELYGFLDESARRLFELLNSVSGIGPKTALGILDLDTVPRIMAAISEKRPELLSRASGIGKRTAERIVLELQNKVVIENAERLTRTMDARGEVEEALVGLGYARADAKKVLATIKQEGSFEEIMKEALKAFGKQKS